MLYYRMLQKNIAISDAMRDRIEVALRSVIRTYNQGDDQVRPYSSSNTLAEIKLDTSRAVSICSEGAALAVMEAVRLAVYPSAEDTPETFEEYGLERPSDALKQEGLALSGAYIDCLSGLTSPVLKLENLPKDKAIDQLLVYGLGLSVTGHYEAKRAAHIRPSTVERAVWDWKTYRLARAPVHVDALARRNGKQEAIAMAFIGERKGGLLLETAFADIDDALAGTVEYLLSDKKLIEELALPKDEGTMRLLVETCLERPIWNLEIGQDRSQNGNPADYILRKNPHAQRNADAPKFSVKRAFFSPRERACAEEGVEVSMGEQTVTLAKEDLYNFAQALEKGWAKSTKALKQEKGEIIAPNDVIILNNHMVLHGMGRFKGINMLNPLETRAFHRSMVMVPTEGEEVYGAQAPAVLIDTEHLQKEGEVRPKLADHSRG